LLEVNAPLALERAEQLDERLRFRGIARRMERWICAHSTKTIVVSTPLRDYLESIGVPRGHCVVMPNGVDPRHFTPQPKNASLLAQLGIPDGAVVIGFTGVLRAWHGLDLLVQAFEQLVSSGRNAFLLIVGDGNYRPTLERLVSELGLQGKVAVTGRVPHAEVPNYVGLFDVAASPRATFYASPMKVLEYMALGKAVVVPGTQNFLDMIDAGVNGLIFADGDARALAATLLDVCDTPGLCRSLGERARAKVERRLNWEWNARASCALIRPEVVATEPAEKDLARD
jgi:glycosyltransferase involved in cell wall biosynthesis